MIILKTILIIFGIVGLMSIFAIIISSSTKTRAKFMEKQIKAAKYMMEENKDILKEISTQSAEISSDSIAIKARAMKKGLLSEEEMFCKHCGTMFELQALKKGIMDKNHLQKYFYMLNFTYNLSDKIIKLIIQTEI